MLRACARVRAPARCTRTSNSHIAIRPIHRGIACLRPSLPSSRVCSSSLLVHPQAAPSSLPHIPRRAHVVLHDRYARVSENDWSYRRRDYLPRRWGGFGRLPSEDQLMWLLIIANLLIACLWWIMSQTPRGRKFMIDNFTVSLRNVKQGRVWTILTSTYSQVLPMHLFANCLGIYFFCPPIINALGSRRFMALYTVGGVFSSFAHLFMHRNDPQSPAMGASGALNAVSVLFGLMNPTATLLLWGIIPMPAGVATALFVGKDVMGLVGGSRDHISHEGHLAGAAVGGLYWLRLTRRI